MLPATTSTKNYVFLLLSLSEFCYKTSKLQKTVQIVQKWSLKRKSIKKFLQKYV